MSGLNWSTVKGDNLQDLVANGPIAGAVCGGGD